MATNFTLHHHIARPISVHYHRPVARSIHLIVIAAAIAFLSVKLWLFWIAYRDIAGSPFARPASLLLIPFIAGVFLIVALTAYGEKAFYRELTYLQKKYKLNFVHAFKHN